MIQNQGQQNENSQFQAGPSNNQTRGIPPSAPLWKPEETKMPTSRMPFETPQVPMQQRSGEFANGGQPKAFVPSNTPGGGFQVAAKRPSLLAQQPKIVGIMSILISVVLLLGVAAYIYVKSTSAADVTLYQVGNQNVTQDVGGGGTVYPTQRVDISYSVVERVVSVFVKAGDKVTAKQPLLQLDPTQLNAQITEASQEVASAQAYLNTVSATGNSVTIAQAQQAYNISKSKYDALVAQLSTFTLNNGKLVAPLAGVVTAVNVNASEIFNANTPLVTIMDESSVVAHIKVPLVSMGHIQIGQSATITPSAIPNLNISGKVTAIIPQADPQTDTFEVWVTIPNQNGVLLPGMSIFARIQQTGIAMAVPRLAVLNPDNESAVFVVREQHAYLEHVHLIGRSESSIFIDSGISANDRVVLVGLDKLQNGQKVNVTAIERNKA